MLQIFKRADMVYGDYKWRAPADHDNPKIISGTDHNELNRTEGYEMLDFINSCAKTWKWDNNPISSYKHLERIIRIEVPKTMHKHSDIEKWICSNYKEI